MFFWTFSYPVSISLLLITMIIKFKQECNRAWSQMDVKDHKMWLVRIKYFELFISSFQLETNLGVFNKGCNKVNLLTEL